MGSAAFLEPWIPISPRNLCNPSTSISDNLFPPDARYTILYARVESPDSYFSNFIWFETLSTMPISASSKMIDVPP